MNKTRRRLLVSMVLAGGAGASVWYWSTRRQEIVFSRDFHVDIIRYVGSAYLEKYPSDRDINGLQGKLFGDETFSSREDVVQHLTSSIESDFTSGETVYLDGWLLSRTEMWFAALSTLTDRVSL